jgi:hypothetical protein
MIQIKTINPVTYNIPGKINSTDTNIVYGKTSNIQLELLSSKVVVNYKYFTLDSNNEEVSIKSGSAIYSYAEIQAVKAALSVNMPSNLDEMDEILWKYREGLRYLMAQTFQIPLSDVINA